MKGFLNFRQNCSNITFIDSLTGDADRVTYKSLVYASHKAQNPSILELIRQMDVQDKYSCLFREHVTPYWGEASSSLALKQVAHASDTAH